MKTQENNRLLPDFLCVGAQRSGTTWLYANLRNHPEIWLPPIKELHYLNSRDKPWRRRANVYLRHLRVRILDHLSGKERLSVWDQGYFLHKRSDRWYQQLFAFHADRVTGEITPDYAVLSEAIIQHIRELNPNLKIIYLLRDPIERSWSGAVKDLARQKGRVMQDVPREEILKKLNGPGPMARSDHLQVLENWERVFGRDHVFIGFFEDIERAPIDLLKRICDFLSVQEPGNEALSQAQVKMNAGSHQKDEIPLEFQRVLAHQQIDQLRKLSQRFGGPAAEWLKRAEAILLDEGE